MTITTGDPAEVITSDADGAPESAGGPMRITVIGTGLLGAVHAACMAEIGHDVLGNTSVAA
ncbi:MAG: hypothetical protein ACRDTA_19230 [Pseudonocardiaceae bacterium]